jgi:hypothetical protein
MNEYKVEKNRFSVKLFFPNKTVREGDIFLSYLAANHEGRERVIDVLNQTDQFIPVYFKDESTKLLSDGKGTEDSVFTDSSIEVVIRLINDICLEANVFFSLPAHSCRVKDFLNQSFLDKSESFLELRKGKEVYLINKAYILFVDEIGAANGGDTWTSQNS